MNAKRSQDYRQKNKFGISVVWVICVFVLLAGVSSNAATSGDPYRYRESGELTSVENGRNVIINSKGYDVDPSVLVVSLKGRPTSLDELTLPVNVNFEWSYMPKGPKSMAPVIVYIEETTESPKEKRSEQ
jgi:hypothetical protein